MQLADFRKNLKYQISSKSFLWEPRCFIWTEGQTDRRKDGHDEANFANASNDVEAYGILAFLARFVGFTTSGVEIMQCENFMAAVPRLTKLLVWGRYREENTHF